MTKFVVIFYHEFLYFFSKLLIPFPYKTVSLELFSIHSTHTPMNFDCVLFFDLKKMKWKINLALGKSFVLLAVLNAEGGRDSSKNASCVWKAFNDC